VSKEYAEPVVYVVLVLKVFLKGELAIFDMTKINLPVIVIETKP